MEDDILGKVVEVEKEIQKRIETEKKKYREWIENVRKDTDIKLADTEAELTESLEKAVKDARTNAGSRASELLRDAEALAKKFQGLSDEDLRPIIIKHITSILPGG